MTKQDYLNELSSELAKYGVEDVEEITSEYEQHFLFKLADGFTEEEIAAKLGAPVAIAAQFSGIRRVKKHTTGKTVLLTIWLAFVGIFEALLDVLFLGFVFALVGAALVTAGFGIELISGFNWMNLLPPMPYLGALVLGIMLLALGVIFFLAALYCFGFLRQLVRASLRWRKNQLADSALPPLPLSPQFSPKVRRTLRSVFLWSVLVFGIMFVLGFAVLALYTKTLGFWHALGWFGYIAP